MPCNVRLSTGTEDVPRHFVSAPVCSFVTQPKTCLWGGSRPANGEVRQTLDKSLPFSLSPSLPCRLEDSPPQPPRKQQSPANNGTGENPGGGGGG